MQLFHYGSLRKTLPIQKESSSYNDMSQAVKRLTKNQDFCFGEIDTAFLTALEEYMRKRGMSQTTMGIYMRNLRALYNKAVESEIFKPDVSPFKKYIGYFQKRP